MADPTRGRSAPRPLDQSETTAPDTTKRRSDLDKRQGGQTKESLKAQVDALGRDARDTAEQLEHEAVDKAKELKHEAFAAADDAKEQVRSVADRQKQAAAGQVSGFAQALKEASGDLENRGQAFAARYVEQAADGLERVSTALEQRDFDDLLGGVGDFARRQPIAFLGGAVLAGLGLARVMKSSAERRGSDGSMHRARAPHSETPRAGNPGPAPGPTSPAGGAPATARSPGVVGVRQGGPT